MTVTPGAFAVSGIAIFSVLQHPFGISGQVGFSSLGAGADSQQGFFTTSMSPESFRVSRANNPEIAQWFASTVYASIANMAIAARTEKWARIPFTN